VIAYLSLGSNVGDSRGHLRAAVAKLRLIDPDLRVSQVYETAPVGGPPQADFLNCVVAVESALTPLQLLDVARRLEAEAERVRTVKDGPRTLDVDVLLVGSLESTSPELTLPHPRMYERAFVLAPLEELDPSLVPTDWRSTVPGAAALQTDVRPVGSLFDG
jgi:2-amino-4-hydroxy-6-hydroxymethyldihydropteridine diphosphokinase